MKDMSMPCFYQKGMIAVIMGELAKRQPLYTTQDLIVSVLDGVHEIITRRSFEPNEIFFAPESSEVKDVFWTQGRSHVIRNTAGRHPENKHWIVDGRLRSNGNTDNKDISLFFACTRTSNPDEANLVVHYTNASTNVHLALPTDVAGKRDFDTAFDVEDTPQVPYFTNATAIDKHVRLVVVDDDVLLEQGKKERAERALALGKGSAEAVSQYKARIADKKAKHDADVKERADALAQDQAAAAFVVGSGGGDAPPIAAVVAGGGARGRGKAKGRGKGKPKAKGEGGTKGPRKGTAEPKAKGRGRWEVGRGKARGRG
jgi:hypothetical protein